MANNHAHSYAIDTKGNGATATLDGHMHSISKFKVSSANGHTHIIPGGVTNEK